MLRHIGFGGFEDCVDGYYGCSGKNDMILVLAYYNGESVIKLGQDPFFYRAADKCLREIRCYAGNLISDNDNVRVYGIDDIYNAVTNIFTSFLKVFQANLIFFL